MSDIGLNLDGVVSLLAAGALCLLLLIALAACSLFAQEATRRTHLIGILSSLAGGGAILLAVVVTVLQSEGRLAPNRVGVWLDRWLLLWVPVVLALWPISALLYRRRQRSVGVGGSKEDAG